MGMPGYDAMESNIDRELEWVLRKLHQEHGTALCQPGGWLGAHLKDVLGGRIDEFKVRCNQIKLLVDEGAVAAVLRAGDKELAGVVARERARVEKDHGLAAGSLEAASKLALALAGLHPKPWPGPGHGPSRAGGGGAAQSGGAGGGLFGRFSQTGSARAAEKTAAEALPKQRKAEEKRRFEEVWNDYKKLTGSDAYGHLTAEERQQAWNELCGILGLAVGTNPPGWLAWREEGDLAGHGVVVQQGPGPEESSFTNSLGMRFAPVGVGGGKRLLFSVWETRVQDYRALAKEEGVVDTSWENPTWEGTKVTPEEDCPVVNVSWEEAVRFCEWLTGKERREGRLGAGQRYRLPTDAEWSWAVGIGDREEAGTPAEKNGKLVGLYPWGTQWPPPPGAGNYADMAAKRAFPSFSTIEGYEDGHAVTSPVGAFPANKHGLHDLGGNVWEWCEDNYNGKDGARVLRGGSWYSNGQGLLLASSRDINDPGNHYYNYGFRCVLDCG